MAKPVRGWKQPTVETITQARSDLEELYAMVCPWLRHHPAGATYFSDELWRILEVLGRLKMSLSFPDVGEIPDGEKFCPKARYPSAWATPQEPLRSPVPLNHAPPPALRP
jgi:hypothetical protein